MTRELYINKTKVDIPDSVDFGQTLQVSKIGDIEILSNYTSTIKLPKTVNNNSIFNNLNLSIVDSATAFSLFSVDYIVNNIIVIEGGSCYMLSQSEEEYEVVILWGNKSFKNVIDNIDLTATYNNYDNYFVPGNETIITGINKTEDSVEYAPPYLLQMFSTDVFLQALGLSADNFSFNSKMLAKSYVCVTKDILDQISFKSEYDITTDTTLKYEFGSGGVLVNWGKGLMITQGAYTRNLGKSTLQQDNKFIYIPADGDYEVEMVGYFTLIGTGANRLTKPLRVMFLNSDDVLVGDNADAGIYDPTRNIITVALANPYKDILEYNPDVVANTLFTDEGITYSPVVGVYNFTNQKKVMSLKKGYLDVVLMPGDMVPDRVESFIARPSNVKLTIKAIHKVDIDLGLIPVDGDVYELHKYPLSIPKLSYFGGSLLPSDILTDILKMQGCLMTYKNGLPYFFNFKDLLSASVVDWSDKILSTNIHSIGNVNYSIEGVSKNNTLHFATDDLCGTQQDGLFSTEAPTNDAASEYLSIQEFSSFPNYIDVEGLKPFIGLYKKEEGEWVRQKAEKLRLIYAPEEYAPAESIRFQGDGAYLNTGLKPILDANHINETEVEVEFTPADVLSRPNKDYSVLFSARAVLNTGSVLYDSFLYIDPSNNKFLRCYSAYSNSNQGITPTDEFFESDFWNKKHTFKVIGSQYIELDGVEEIIPTSPTTVVKNNLFKPILIGAFQDNSGSGLPTTINNTWYAGAIHKIIFRNVDYNGDFLAEVVFLPYVKNGEAGLYSEEYNIWLSNQGSGTIIAVRGETPAGYSIPTFKIEDNSAISTLATILNKPATYKPSLMLTEQDIANLDFSKPVKISQLNGVFFIQKISNYIQGQPTEVELIKIR